MNRGAGTGLMGGGIVLIVVGAVMYWGVTVSRAGWFNITSGRIYRIGDRIELGGVRGDVIDITLLRTKMPEADGLRHRAPGILDRDRDGG